ncbi:MAG TPA: FAD-dependent oxidoreductase [Spirochaetia bacterium]|nr:FAD-dependent oxidoreductase [Spirochaetia bacterium]
MIRKDAVIIGAGPAGLGAAIALKENGISNVLVVEREDYPGGLLHQCIHIGFGLHHFREELTGPEYAERVLKVAGELGVEIKTGAVVLDISTDEIEKADHTAEKVLRVLSEKEGLLEVRTKAVVLAMGCREKNRGNINIPGSRPAGIMTAGLAQRLVNLEGYLPGKEVVILGSGDIGLIMARRMTWEGARVKGVVEIQPYPGGLNRNIVQCLMDFQIPLYLSHTITEIRGGKRIEAVEVSPIDTHHEPSNQGRFVLTCDTLLLSVGLIPENELSRKAGVVLDPVTQGPVVDSNLMTSVPGIFACGNVLHVHDIVDYVSEEAEFCGLRVALYLKGGLEKGQEIPVRVGNLVRYVLPAKVERGGAVRLALRPIVPAENAVLTVRDGKQLLYSRKYRKVFPSNMLRVPLKNIPASAESIEVSFQLNAE